VISKRRTTESAICFVPYGITKLRGFGLEWRLDGRGMKRIARSLAAHNLTANENISTL